MFSNAPASDGLGGNGGSDHGIGVVRCLTPRDEAFLEHRFAIDDEADWRP